MKYIFYEDADEQPNIFDKITDSELGAWKEHVERHGSNCCPPGAYCKTCPFDTEHNNCKIDCVLLETGTMILDEIKRRGL